MKKAFIFPGQGSQYVGMGKDLYEHFQEVRELYDQAEEILEFPLKKISFEGPEEDLKQTRYTQPALFVHSLAISNLLEKRKLVPDATAGHSLGEYSALVVAGAFSWKDGLKIVKIRGEQMQQSGEKNPGTMAALIGLSKQDVEEICSAASAAGIVQPANFNSPGQIVISGSINGVHKAMELAKEHKARLVTELVVSGAFHSPLMGDALSGLTTALEELPIVTPRIPVYTNVTANPASSAEEVRHLLKQQLLAPVLWEDIINHMITDGISEFYEVGAGKVLQGLLKRINSEVAGKGIGKVEDLEG
ncbi:MAG: ACP S-malonyltransferase [bacterium]|nr:MAG: ACP S-malonyltransferase [bacterium]